MSRFNAKLPLTGRTRRGNISAAGDHIHLMLMLVLLLLLCTLLSVLRHNTYLSLKMGKFVFLLKSCHRRYGRKRVSLPLHSTSLLPLTTRATSLTPFTHPGLHRDPPLLQPPLLLAVNLELLGLVPITTCQ